MNSAAAAEVAVVLVALDASMRLCSGDDEREVKVENFYSDAGIPDLRGVEIIKEVRLPRYAPAQLESRGVETRMCRAYKVSKRWQADDAIVVGCFAVIAVAALYTLLHKDATGISAAGGPA